MRALTTSAHWAWAIAHWGAYDSDEDEDKGACKLFSTLADALGWLELELAILEIEATP